MFHQNAASKLSCIQELNIFGMFNLERGGEKMTTLSQVPAHTVAMATNAYAYAIAGKIRRRGVNGCRR